MAKNRVETNERPSNKTWKRLGVAGLAVGGVSSLVSLGAARYLVDQLTGLKPVDPGEAYTFSPFETNVDYEEVSFPTANNRILAGWWLPRPDTRRVVVCVSGYRGKKEDVLGISSILWRNGFNVLLFDYRAHGFNRREGELITLGHRELEDIQAALRYVKSRIEHPLLGLLGGSMGAAVVLTATARDADVMAVWADSAFASQREIISHVWQKQTHLPSRPVVDIAGKLFNARTGYRWADFAPINEIAKIAPRPVYIVHGGADTLVPVNCAYRLYAAAQGPKEMWIEDGVEHCGVYFAFRAEYARRAVRFYEKYLTERPLLATRPVEKVAFG